MIKDIKALNMHPFQLLANRVGELLADFRNTLYYDKKIMGFFRPVPTIRNDIDRLSN